MDKNKTPKVKDGDTALGGEHVEVTYICADSSVIGYFTSSDAFDGEHPLVGGTAKNDYDHGPKWIKWAIGVISDEGQLANWTLDASCKPDGHEFESGYIGPYSRGGPDMYGYKSDYFRTIGGQADIKVVIDRPNKTIRCGYSGFDTAKHR